MPYDKTSTDWKDFLLRHKWMPTNQLVSRFGLKKHDVDNFRRWPNVRAVLEPWRVSLQQSPARLQSILSDAWKFILNQSVRFRLAMRLLTGYLRSSRSKIFQGIRDLLFSLTPGISSLSVPMSIENTEKKALPILPLVLSNFGLGKSFFGTQACCHICFSKRTPGLCSS